MQTQVISISPADRNESARIDQLIEEWFEVAEVFKTSTSPEFEDAPDIELTRDRATDKMFYIARPIQATRAKSLDQILAKLKMWEAVADPENSDAFDTVGHLYQLMISSAIKDLSAFIETGDQSPPANS